MVIHIKCPLHQHHRRRPHFTRLVIITPGMPQGTLDAVHPHLSSWLISYYFTLQFTCFYYPQHLTSPVSILAAEVIVVVKLVNLFQTHKNIR